MGNINAPGEPAQPPPWAVHRTAAAQPRREPQTRRNLRNPWDVSAYRHVPSPVQPGLVVAGALPWSISRRPPSVELVATHSVEALLSGLLQHQSSLSHLNEWFRYLIGFQPATLSLDESIIAHEINARLESLSKQLKVCPVQFKQGDFVWSCVQCQRDETCVLCNDCYNQSDHKNHEVHFTRVTTTSGGCCDCGDAGAWNPQGFCPHHGSSTSPEAGDAVLHERATLVLTFLFKWLVDALSYLKDNHTKEAGDGLIYVDTTDASTAEEAQQRLRKMDYSGPFEDEDAGYLIACSLDQWKELEEVIEHLPANLQSCLVITTDSKADASARLEKRAERVIECLLGLCQSSDVISRISTVALTGPVHEAESPLANPFANPTPLVEKLLVCHAFMQSSRQSLLNLFLRLLVDNIFKERFALAYARAYRDATSIILEHAEENSDSLSPEDKGLEETVFRLSVQFLNRPPFVLALVKHLGFLDSLMWALRHVLRDRAGVESKSFVDVGSFYIREGYYDSSTGDFRHALTSPGVGQTLCRTRLVDFVQTIALTQGMHPQKRRGVHEEHVLIETRHWEWAFNLALNLGRIMYSAVWWLSEPGVDVREVEAFARDVCRIAPLPHDLAATSWHIPVSRFASLALTRCLLVQGVPLDACLLPISTARAFATDAAMVLARAAQVRAEMWRRHGTEALHQEAYYTGSLVFSQTSMELDLRTLQLCGLALSGEELLEIITNAFQVNEEDYQISMYEFMLDLVCILVTEIAPNAQAIADVQTRELRRLLLHRLAVAPDSYGGLESNTGFCDGRVHDDLFSRTLNELADDLTPPDSMGAVGASKFDLKKSMWDSVNPFYFRLSTYYREKTMDRLRARKRDKAQPRPLVPFMPEDVSPRVLPVRYKLLQAARLLSMSSLGMACKDKRWVRILGASLHLLTLQVHAGVLLPPGAGEPSEDLKDVVQCLCDAAKSADTDVVLQDGAKFILDKLASQSPAIDELCKAHLNLGDGSKDSAQARKLDAQKRAMEKMKRLQQSTARFTDAAGMDLDEDSKDASGAGAGGMEHDDEEHEEDDGATCVYCSRPASQGETLGFIGFLFYSPVLIGNSPTRLVQWNAYEPRLAYSQCGHQMHFKCFESWAPAYDFQCPLCKGLSNVLAPKSSEDRPGIVSFLIRVHVVTGKDLRVRYIPSELLLENALRFVWSVGPSALCDPARADGMIRVAKTLLSFERGLPIAESLRSASEVGLGRAVVRGEMNSYAHYLRVKVAQLLLDPMDASAVDCGVGKFAGALPGFLSQPSGDWWLQVPPGEGEALASWRLALEHGMGISLKELQGARYRHGPELVHWTRRGLDAFRQLALALGCVDVREDVASALSVENVDDLLALGGWQEYLAAVHPIGRAVTTLEVAPHPMFRQWLVPLPAEYTDLVSMVEQGRCDSPGCGRPRHNSALCLVCGQVLTLSPCSADDSGMGSATRHARQAHHGVGCLYMLEKRIVLWVYQMFLAEGPPLYVDKHGDWMGGGGRGLPLRLDSRRFEFVSNLWVSNAAPREISRLRGLADRPIPPGAL